LLSEHFSLLCILVGSALFTFTVGPFQNWDTNHEYQAVTGILKWGLPWIGAPGNMINQPPLGFFIDSSVFRVFGSSFNTGVDIVTCFGICCVLLVYFIGKAWYGKTTGLVGAALFAVTPWQVVFSRSFLIDVQCLFFSLLFLLIGYYAIRKDSIGLFMLSGVFLGFAFLTKFYGIFMVLPLAIFYFRDRQNKLRRPWVPFAFFLPMVTFLLLWYQGVGGVDILTIFWQDDFKSFNAAGSTPSSLFTFNYLVGNLGMFFLAAAVISLLVSIFYRKTFRKILAADSICVATIVLVLGIDVFLALGLNFRAPYTTVFKYDYQSLPFFCLLAGSLPSKFQTLIAALKMKLNRNWIFLGISLLGTLFLIVAIFSNFYFAHVDSQLKIVAFTVERQVSYSFSNSAQTVEPNILLIVQYVGFAMVLLGLIWAAEDRFTKKSLVADHYV
jgi:4-amino-4-deoxy-L-arabinose transferase-like glycosyltransferase